jgi:hypothetical protein
MNTHPERTPLPRARRRALSEYSEVVPTTECSGPRVRALGWARLATRALGALALLATGAIHLHEYLGLYSQIPTIGTLFLLNFISATAIGLSLLAPVERAAPNRMGALLVALLAVAGVALAATAFAFLKISEQTPVFGFKEPGYDPSAIAAVQAAEIATVLLLGASLIAQARLRAPLKRW